MTKTIQLAPALDKPSQHNPPYRLLVPSNAYAATFDERTTGHHADLSLGWRVANASYAYRIWAWPIYHDVLEDCTPYYFCLRAAIIGWIDTGFGGRI